MKRSLSSIIFFFFVFFLQAQIKKISDPLIIKGQLLNCAESILLIHFEDNNGLNILDTIRLDSIGNFHFKTHKIQKPQQTSIQRRNTQINNIFVAPGYHLNITGDAKSFLSLLASKKITGIGAESNRFVLLRDSILVARNDTTRWYELSEPNLLTHIKKEKCLHDSIANAVFSKKNIRDKYFYHFRKMVEYDNLFIGLNKLLNFVLFSQFDYEKSVSFVKDNFNKNVLNNISYDEYLISSNYKNFVIFSEYLNYQLRLEHLKFPAHHNIKEEHHKLEKANRIYNGKVRDYVLLKRMANAIESSKSFDELNKNRKEFPVFVSVITNHNANKIIDSLFTVKEMDLLRTQVGKPAPAFSLQSNTGESHNLNDYKGKIVYIDLWASWCHPCRAETPYLKKLHRKYKNDNRITFLSVAVHDSFENWKKAIEEDKPDWLQLWDKDGTVAKDYLANAIPQFILINKQGNIVNFNAPRPSEEKALEELINREIMK